MKSINEIASVTLRQTLFTHKCEYLNHITLLHHTLGRMNLHKPERFGEPFLRDKVDFYWYIINNEPSVMGTSETKNTTPETKNEDNNKRKFEWITS